MFDAAFHSLVGEATIEERHEGVAFFKVAKSVYRNISSIAYLAVNIPIATHRNRYLHCAYSDTRVKQAISPKRIETSRLVEADLRWPHHANSADTTPGAADNAAAARTQAGLQETIVPLRPLRDEFAVFGICGDVSSELPRGGAAPIPREFQILANYFHQHIMRIYGHDAAREMIMSARELDCLKWIAEGKTAWEVSVILGISERTVRFHLNSAREKMNCATTTQAVAKAVAQNLIPV